MNKTSLVSLLLLIAMANSTMVLQHECAHSKLWMLLNQTISEYHGSDYGGRNLQEQTPRQMKITYDMSFLDKNLNSTREVDMIFKENAKRAIEIATKYFSDLITIIPKPIDSMKYPSSYCHIAPVPKEDQENGRDSDLHLYITFTYAPTATYLAFAGACRMLKGIGPTHGIVNFNFGVLQKFDLSNTIIAQDLVEIVIHEMTHVLGFSPSAFPLWIDENKQAYKTTTVTLKNRGLNTNFLITPNVLNHAREYYGCSTLPGMPLENQGLPGSVGSHWEVTAIQDEIMTASIAPHQSLFTKFTTALLRDTGFYSSVSSHLEENSFFGLNEGCGFILGSCSDFKREFCTSGQVMTCDFYRYGTSHCSKTIYTDNECQFQRVYFNSKCYSPLDNFMNTASFIKQRGLSFGANSRCFNSSLMKLKTLSKTYSMGACYQFSCSEAKQVIITVGDQKVTCSRNGEVLSVPGYMGTIECPDKLDEFCEFKQFCPKNCSNSGYCISGKCHCLPSYTGEACDISA